MTPDDKFQQSGTIRPDPAPLDAVTSSKAGLSTAGTRITRVSSRQTAMTSRSLHGPAGDVPGHGARPKRECTEADGSTRSLHDLDGLKAVSPGLQKSRKDKEDEKENVCGRDLGFLEDRSMFSMKSC